MMHADCFIPVVDSLPLSYVCMCVGGEKKRVSIGMELVADPLVLYLDEPTSGLDASSAKDVIAALQRVAELGTTGKLAVVDV